MAKNKLIKNITIDQLAEIISKGFDGQMEYMGKKFDKIDGKFDKIDERFDKVEKDLTVINKHVADAVRQAEFDRLEGRVDYLENILDVPAKKH